MRRFFQGIKGLALAWAAFGGAFAFAAGVVHEPQNPCDMLVGQSREACYKAGQILPRDLQIYFYDLEGGRYGVPTDQLTQPCAHLKDGREYRLYRSNRDRAAGQAPVKAFRCEEGKESPVRAAAPMGKK